MNSEEIIGVVGLGYVGLPVALAFAERFERVVGVDIDASRIAELRAGHDRTDEIDGDVLRRSTLQFSASPESLGGCSMIIVTVPTPIDANRQPDLGPLVRASESVGRFLSKGAVVVYESTVYPGVTEDVCGPILERASGLRRGSDFTLGYSPE
jgi:UDP-N-acetyl-D-galactosamine dehydrogenase